MAENHKLTVVGVYHCITGSRHSDLMEYVNNISPDKKISIESYPSIESLLIWEIAVPKDQWTEDELFIIPLISTLRKKNVKVEAVEDKKLYKLVEKMVKKYFKEKENKWKEIDLLADKLFREANILRSIAMYERARKNNSDILIMGGCHAYHLAKLKKEEVDVVYFTDVPLEFRIMEQKTLSQYLKGNIKKEDIIEAAMERY